MLTTLIAQATDWSGHVYDVDGVVVPGFDAFEVILSNTLGVAAIFVGIAIFIMFLVGGFKFLASGGDQKQTTAAKQTLTWAAFGLFAMIGVWFVFRLLNKITGANLLNLSIPKPAILQTNPSGGSSSGLNSGDSCSFGMNCVSQGNCCVDCPSGYTITGSVATCD